MVGREKARPGRTLSASQRGHNRRFGKVRAKIERVFRGVKCQFGYRLVRYRGIANNDAQMFSLLALANLYLARGKFASREAGGTKKPRGQLHRGGNWGNLRKKPSPTPPKVEKICVYQRFPREPLNIPSIMAD